KLSRAVVADKLGKPIANLLERVLRMVATIRAHSERGPVLGQGAEQSETVRKLLAALVDDVPVALIKLAVGTSLIPAVKDNRQRRYKVAREVADVYAPLAHRLGIGHIKWELEDLSFRYLQPEAYKKIAKLLDEKRLDRQGYIEKVMEESRAALEKVGIH